MENKLKHTPGPWAYIKWDGYSRHNNHIVYPVSISDNKALVRDGFIAKVNWFPYDEANVTDETNAGIANAKLIAAAPDMLQALIDVRDKLLNVLVAAEHPEIFITLNNAIKQATK